MSATTPFDSIRWFMGVIEDVNDPLKTNRVRVRAVNFHTPDRSALPTSGLPWASVMNSSMKMSAPVMNQGDWVVGFFLDGKFSQQPVIIGMLDGIPIDKIPQQGYYDPSGTYPKELNKPTTSSVARGDTASPSNPSNYVKGSVTTGVPTASGGSWSEPAPSYAPKYPNDHVLHTNADNILEFDDTPGSERVHIFHHSGSLVEFRPDGSVVTRVIGTDYSITSAGKNVAVSGDYNVTVSGNINMLAGGTLTLAAKTINLAASSGIVLSGQNVSMAGSTVAITGSSSASINSGGTMVIDGSNVKIADGGATNAPTLPSPSAPDVSPISKYQPS